MQIELFSNKATFTPIDGMNVNALYVSGYYYWQFMLMD